MKDNSLTPEEFERLSKRNRTLLVLDSLTEKNQSFVKEIIKKSLQPLADELEQAWMTSFQSIELTDYRVENGLDLFPRLNEELATLLLSSTTNQGSHLICFSFAEFERWFEGKGLTSKEEGLNLLSTGIQSGFEQFYQTFSSVSNLNTNVHTHSVNMLGMDEFPTKETSEVGSFDWNQLVELKQYQFTLESDPSFSLTIYHVSDLEFTEYVYNQVARVLEPTKEETQMNEKNQPVLNANVGEEQISTPVFAELKEDELLPSSKLPLNILEGVPLEVSVVLGKTFMTVEDVLNLSVGRVIPLNKYATDSLEIYVQGELVAYGDPVTIEEKYGIKITKIGDGE